MADFWPFIYNDKLLNKGLVTRAIRDSYYQDMTDEDIEAVMENPDMIMLGNRNNLSIVLISGDPREKAQVVAFLAENAKMRRKLAAATVEMLNGMGYNSFWAINSTGHPDAVWQRALTPKGWKSRPIGTLMEFKRNG